MASECPIPGMSKHGRWPRWPDGHRRSRSKARTQVGLPSPRRRTSLRGVWRTGPRVSRSSRRDIPALGSDPRVGGPARDGGISFPAGRERRHFRTGHRTWYERDSYEPCPGEGGTLSPVVNQGSQPHDPRTALRDAPRPYSLLACNPRASTRRCAHEFQCPARPSQLRDDEEVL